MLQDHTWPTPGERDKEWVTRFLNQARLLVSPSDIWTSHNNVSWMQQPNLNDKRRKTLDWQQILILRRQSEGELRDSNEEGKLRRSGRRRWWWWWCWWWGGQETRVHYLINLTAAVWESDGLLLMLRAGAIYHGERRLTLCLSTPLTFINSPLKNSPTLLVTHTQTHKHPARFMTA